MKNALRSESDARIPQQATRPVPASTVPTGEPDIEGLRDLIAKVESDRDAWRAAGREEKYLQAYFLVDALELQLVRRLQQRA